MPEGPWPDEVVHLHREGLSTRSVECECDGENAFSIRMVIAGSPEDYDLAYRVFEAVAPPGATIEDEYGTEFSLEALHKQFSEPAIWERIAGEVDLVVRAMKDSAELPGPAGRSYCFGPRTLARWGPMDDAARARRFIDEMRGVLYADGDTASRFEATTPGTRNVVFAVWMEGRTCLLPPTSHVLVQVDEEELVMVRREDFLDVAGPHGELVDEAQVFVRGVEGADWQRVVERARAVETPLPQPKKRWWQFWR